MSTKPIAIRPIRSAMIILIVFSISLITANTTDAQVHGACKECGKWVVLSETGAGFARDWEGVCGQCELMENPSWFGINENRYIHFADGTVIDMKHFRGSMILSLYGSYAFGGRAEGIVFANGVGWLIEYNQYRNGHPSGHPYGGNEDLWSNFAGSAFAQSGYSFFSFDNWAEQAIPYLERIHGSVVHVTDQNKEK